MPRAFLGIVLYAIVSVCGAATLPAPARERPSTREGVLALADSYARDFTPKLASDDRATVEALHRDLEARRQVPALQARTVAEAVNHLTVALSTSRSVEAVIVASAQLVPQAPGNARVTNLLAAALHAIRQDRDALTVLEYTRSLSPRNTLYMLNTANVLLDLQQDAKAKALLDKVIAQEPTNKSAYASLATYWYKQGNMKNTLEALMKASTYKGLRVKKVARKNGQVTEKNEVTGSDPVPAMEKKLDAMKELVPNTTAELIEEAFPDVARKIRDQYARLVDRERMVLPLLPEVNTSGLKNWLEKGLPYVKEWQRAFKKRADRAALEMAHLSAGVEPGDSKQVRQQKFRAAGRQQTEKSLADAQKLLQMMEGMPGIPRAQLAEARKKFRGAMAGKGVGMPAEAAASDEPGEGQDEAEASGGPRGEPVVPPGWDSGSMFAVSNYLDYSRLRNGYELYLAKYFEDHQAQVNEILTVYGKKLAAERQVHEDRLQDIAEQQAREQDAARRARGAGAEDEGVDLEKYEVARRREDIRFRKAVNFLSNDYFAQWVNLAMPQYVHKMKPMIETYWASCALYIRNMNDPEVMKAEYLHVKSVALMYSGLAVGSLAAQGREFVYMGETDEEERQIEENIREAAEDARQRQEEYAALTRAAEDALEKWLDENVAFAVKGEFLSFKITPRKLIIESYIAGISIRNTYDFKNDTWTIHRSLAAKIDIGIQVGPLSAKVEAGVDMLETYDTFNVRNGQVMESGGRFGQASAGVSSGAGPFEAGKAVEVTLDPALESAFSVSTSDSLGFERGGFSVKGP